jgi:hypothetical protein
MDRDSQQQVHCSDNYDSKHARIFIELACSNTSLIIHFFTRTSESNKDSLTV